MKKIIIFLIAAVFIIQIVSCSRTDKPQDSAATESSAEAVIKNDVPVSEIAARYDRLLSNVAKLTAVDNDYITGMLGLDLDNVSEYVLKVQTSGTEVDSYGIFKLTDEAQAGSLAGSIRDYLDMLNDNWENFNYLPEEMPKIKAAEVKSAGVYVTFVIASEDEKNAVFDEFYSAIEG
jgi:hypothetical protein